MDHSNNNDIDQCIPVVKSRFQAYTGSAHAGSGNFAQPSTPESLAPDGSSVSSSLPHDQLVAAESSSLSFNSESLLAPANPTNTEARPSRVDPASLNAYKRKAGATLQKGDSGGTGRRTKRQQISKEEKDKQLVRSTTALIKGGLQELSVENFPSLVSPTDTVLSPGKEEAEAYTCADYLWHCADEAANTSATAVWSLRYIAACSLLVGMAYTSSAEVVTDLQVSFSSCERARQIC